MTAIATPNVPGAPAVERTTYPWTDLPAITTAVALARNTYHDNGNPDRRNPAASRGEHVATRFYVATHYPDGTPRDPSDPITREHVVAHATMNATALRNGARTGDGIAAVRPLAKRIAAAIGPDGNVIGDRSGWNTGRWLCGTLAAWIAAIPATPRTPRATVANDA